jgi:hypothetical protein
VRFLQPRVLEYYIFSTSNLDQFTGETEGTPKGEIYIFVFVFGVGDPHRHSMAVLKVAVFITLIGKSRV